MKLKKKNQDQSNQAQGERLQTAVLIGDPHGNLSSVNRICEHIEKAHRLGDVSIDVVLVTGDIGKNILPPRRGPNHGEVYIWKHDAVEVLQRIEDMGFPVVFTPGNHDLKTSKKDLSFGSVVCADRNVINVGGFSILGWGGAQSAMGWPYEWDQKEAVRDFSTAMGHHQSVDILLSHSPPYAVGDRTVGGNRAGSVFIREISNMARFVACGHIHEAWGVYGLDSTIVCNAGGLGAPFEQEHVVWIHKKGEQCWAVSQNLQTGLCSTAIETSGSVGVVNSLVSPDDVSGVF